MEINLTKLFAFLFTVACIICLYIVVPAEGISIGIKLLELSALSGWNTFWGIVALACGVAPFVITAIYFIGKFVKRLLIRHWIYKMFGIKVPLKEVKSAQKKVRKGNKDS